MLMKSNTIFLNIYGETRTLIYLLLVHTIFYIGLWDLYFFCFCQEYNNLMIICVKI